MIDLKLALDDILPSCPTAFTLGKKSYSKLRIPFHPLFSICKRIELQPASQPFFQEMLQMLNGDREYFNIIAIEDIVKNAWNYFKVRLIVEPQCLANQIIGLIKNGQDLDVLESLSTTTLCSGLIHVQNKSSDILDEIEKYLDGSNRSDTEKRMVRAHIVVRGKREKTGKETKQVVREAKQAREVPKQLPKQATKQDLREVIKPIKPTKVQSSPIVNQAAPSPSKIQYRKHSNESISSKKKKKKQRRQKQDESQEWQQQPQKTEQIVQQINVPQANNVPEDYENPMQTLSKGQRKRWADMIHLGLDGDSQQNWRERYRPSKVPPRKPKEQHIEEVYQFKKAYDLPVVFEYAAKGQGFDFSSLKLPVLMHIQPENIEILMDKGEITITKEGKGFKRPTEYIWTKDGFFAQGLTLLLNGMTDIEDGGKVINGAKLSDVVGDCNWFQIKNMTIYKK